MLLRGSVSPPPPSSSQQPASADAAAAAKDGGGGPEAVARRSLFVTNIPDCVKPGNVHEMFDIVGRVEDVRKQYDVKSETFGYVIVFKKEAGARAGCMLAEKELGGGVLSIEYMGQKMRTRAVEAKEERQNLDVEDLLTSQARQDQTVGEQLEVLMKAAREGAAEVGIVAKAGGDSEEKITEPCYFCTSMKHHSRDCELCPGNSGGRRGKEKKEREREREKRGREVVASVASRSRKRKYSSDSSRSSSAAAGRGREQQRRRRRRQDSDSDSSDVSSDSSDSRHRRNKKKNGKASTSRSSSRKEDKRSSKSSSSHKSKRSRRY